MSSDDDDLKNKRIRAGLQQVIVLSLVVAIVFSLLALLEVKFFQIVMVGAFIVAFLSLGALLGFNQWVKHKRQAVVIVFLLLTGIFATFGYSAVRYSLDQHHFERGHQAYQAGDCSAAIDEFDKVIHAWRIVEIGGIPARAMQEEWDCEPYQDAVSQELVGNYGAALSAYLSVMTEHSGGVLAGHARERASSIFDEAQVSAIANDQTCASIDVLLDKGLVPPLVVPRFLVACAQAYQQDERWFESLEMYSRLFKEYAGSSIISEAETALMAEMAGNVGACDQLWSGKESLTTNRPTLLPRLYDGCGHAYQTTGDWDHAMGMYKQLLSEYPASAEATEAEKAVLASISQHLPTCDDYIVRLFSLNNAFIPVLSFGCGKVYESAQDWTDAINLYDNFLANSPEHAYASEVEQGLARLVIARAKGSSTVTKTTPEATGVTEATVSQIIFQNDSPDELRIVFSGPVVQVEKLAACSSCEHFTGSGPESCPQKGPLATYTLIPGQYEMVVESINDSGMPPWIGNWSLVGGSEYSTCFFIVTNPAP